MAFFISGSPTPVLRSKFRQSQIFLERQTELARPGFSLSDGESSMSDFSDTESSSVEMVEIPDGEVVWLFDGQLNDAKRKTLQSINYEK